MTPILLLLVLSACSSEDEWTKNLPETVPATGVILLDGEPVEGASVVFAPVPPDNYPANALTDSSGRFELKAFPSKDGAVPGSYQVGVSRTVEVSADSMSADQLGEDAAHAAESPTSGVNWINALPNQYANPTMSGIELTIPDDGTSDLKIELSSAP
ncbi:transthyretin-like family protein [Maioricimonas rarisocia]|nr:carboxypeptidase-like regulatory domain-containing protein [Maioricimonas rarisocia]